MHKPISREEAKAVITDIDAKIRAHCRDAKTGEQVPADRVNSVTRTDVPDGKGGVLTASAYGSKLFQERISGLFPGGLGEKLLGILHLSSEEGEKIVVELGAENFKVLRESFATIDAEARALDISYSQNTELMYTITSGMAGSLSGAQDAARTLLEILQGIEEAGAKRPSAKAISAEEAKRIVLEVEAKVREHWEAAAKEHGSREMEFKSYAKTDVPDGEGGMLTAEQYARGLLNERIAKLVVGPERCGEIETLLNSSIAEATIMASKFDSDTLKSLMDTLIVFGSVTHDSEFKSDVVKNALSMQVIVLDYAVKEIQKRA